MDDIAKEAGFTKPILYQYFESKTELYREIVNQTAEKLLTRLRNAVAEVDSPRAKIEVAFRGLFRNGRQRDRRLSHSLHPLTRRRDQG